MNIQYKSTLDKFFKILNLKNYSKRTIEIYTHVSTNLLSQIELAI